MAFAEQGVAMLSSVLNSARAIQVNIQIMRAFTQLRQMLSTHDESKKKVEVMEKTYDENVNIVFATIKQLIETDARPKKKIGFNPGKAKPIEKLTELRIFHLRFLNFLQLLLKKEH